MTPAAARTLILGGVRSGKSRLAEDLARGCGLPVTYVATARAGDTEMARRIEAHRLRRPPHWRVVEESVDLPGVLDRASAPGGCLLVECLTLWLTNLLVAPEGVDIEARIDDLVSALVRAPGQLILVGNETNMGIVPLGELSRRYCDLAGTMHQRLAAGCDQVLLMVAGLPLVLKGPPPPTRVESCQ